MHEAGEPLVLVERIIAKGVLDEPGFASFNRNNGALMLICVEISVVAFAHEAMKKRRKFGKPMDVLNTADLPGFLFGEFVTFPYLQFFNRFPEKQEFTMLFVIGFRIKQEDALLLFDAAQVK